MGTELERRPSAALAAMHGRHKAAVALVALGPERAAEILSHMPPAEVEVLSVEMAELWGVDRATTEGVLDELADGVDSQAGLMSGGVDYAREVLVHLVGPDRAEEILGGLATSGEFRPFEFLRRTPPEQIRTFLADEAPQTIALVLSSLYAGLSGRVLAELPSELQTEVASRIAQMGETNPEVIADVDAGLRQKLSAISTQEFASPGGIDSLAEILNSAGRSAERTVIEGLATLDPALADEVRMRMFTFEDMAELEDREIQLILREVDQKDLVARPARRRRGAHGQDPAQPVPARRGDAPRGHGGLPAAAARRRRGGPGQGRRGRATPRGGWDHHPARRWRRLRGRASVSGLFELPVLEPTAVPVDPYPVAGAPAGPSPEDIVAQAHAEAEAIRAQAREEGFHAGLQAAQAELASGRRGARGRARARSPSCAAEVADGVERGAVVLGSAHRRAGDGRGHRGRPGPRRRHCARRAAPAHRSAIV